MTGGRVRRPRRGRVAVPSLVAGVGLAASLPPWGVWVVAPPAAAVLWWRLSGLRLRQRLLAGWLAGLGLFVPGLWWVFSFNVYGAAVLMGVEAVALALACTACPSGRGRAAALAGAMVLVEALRSIWPFGGLPLGGVALGQAGGPLAGADRLGGPLLLVGLVWLAGGGLGSVIAAAWGRWRAGAEPRWGRGRRLGPAGAGLSALVAVGAVAAWGSVAADGGAAVAVRRVAAVQGGGARGLRKAEVSPATVLAAERAATAEIPAADGGRAPSLVVWPEDVVSIDGSLGGSADGRILADTAKHLGATLVVGVTETVSATAFRNEIVVFGPDGAVVARFEKVHRVPFGEYVPDRAFFSHLANLSAVPLDAIAGHGDGLLDTPAGRLGAMVSYEVFFAERGWVSTRAGAQLLVVPTNTASYATSQVPTQEIAASRLQAIAEGRDLVQASPTGFSALVDNRGTVLSLSSLGRRQVMIGDVALRSGRTLYERFGDLPVLVGAALLVVGGWVAAVTEDTTSAMARRERAWLAHRRAPFPRGR